MYSINAVIDIYIVRKDFTLFGEANVKKLHTGREVSSHRA
jgi:hypothetical protein